MFSFDKKKWCREIILDHYKNCPKNFQDRKGYKMLSMNNPTCGDKVTIQVLFKKAIIEDIIFNCIGCSICCASTSMLSQNSLGKSISYVLNFINNFNNMIEGKKFNEQMLSDSICLQGIAKFPARKKCALLSYHILNNIIEEFKNEEK